MTARDDYPVVGDRMAYCVCEPTARRMFAEIDRLRAEIDQLRHADSDAT